MSNKTLLLIGSGPGIGVSVASLFAQRYFDNIALFARNPIQLEKDRETVLASAASVNRVVTVQTWQVDISDLRRLEEALFEVAQFGALECVYFNAARVAPSPFFDFPISGIEEDFKVSNLALYAVAKWAMPLLCAKATSGNDRPSFLVTSSLLPVDPVPELFALSMVKAAQANLVKSLDKAFTPQGVHVGLVVVGGQVSSSAPALNPRNIAEQAWNLFAQEREDWTGQVSILEDKMVDWQPSI
ncbi:putative short-chain alcohol dehydrogenase [Aspergillus novofumigatus IBT 16806]|uniref:Putative NADP(+)-dependent dehydrogenase n=1 Tax=Aspergillus novofumigatus (strain IBT 16806) TaxID=1392255 RepID=A0A2I1C1E7_ASPN1|nr:putative NADP(+)-dependent dehydrogenase [Aspergillus novofumigatus IBT 16806]PKX91460.1 putative NADP(+)-dependent dehydrogenase [Aspergillus novofumigatus IBT 16806]